ncbi:unnamed protein product [Pleuronectes platessa]|uniref:Tetratricopeptide repeat domain 23 n=1 Tax=Pleuronectes platessa TaxID=8262 RepID=A0A9N7W0E5_PLEPL|nr:unnamed protein product [Pleuronectes platessa]
MAKTPPCSSDSPAECSESVVSLRGSFMMVPPEEKLKHFNSRAQAHEDNQEFDACIQDLVRCVALTRLVYGEGHLKVAQAHARLAKAYFQLKGWGLQALEHSALARELLPVCSSISSCREEVLKDLHQHSAIDEEDEMKTALEISTSLCRVYKRQNRPDEALNQCEKSLQLLKDGDKPDKTCSAHAIAMRHSPGALEEAQISHSLALIHSAAAEPHHNESAGQYFEQSLSAYKNSVGPQDPAFLTAQDHFCRFLLLNDQQERCVEIQRTSLTPKRFAFGDLSAEVADTLQLIGSVEMSEGRMTQAHRTMKKCLEIQNWMCGPQHKKTKATQKAVDMLAR